MFIKMQYFHYLHEISLLILSYVFELTKALLNLFFPCKNLQLYTLLNLKFTRPPEQERIICTISYVSGPYISLLCLIYNYSRTSINKLFFGSRDCLLTLTN